MSLLCDAVVVGDSRLFLEVDVGVEPDVVLKQGDVVVIQLLRDTILREKGEELFSAEDTGLDEDLELDIAEGVAGLDK